MLTEEIVELEQVLINGREADSGLPLRALFFGEGLFETFRYKSRMPLFFERHYERMLRGARLLEIPLIGMDSLAEMVQSAVNSSGISDAYIKICLLSGGDLAYYKDAARGDIAIVIRDYEGRGEPIRVSVNEFRSISGSPLHGVKSLNYLENILARRAARLRGYDEALFLNERGEIAEGTSSNIFWVSGDTLYTPAVECGILPGVIRGILIDSAGSIGLRVEEGGYGLESMSGSRFAFLTNSLSGPVPISLLEDMEFPLDDGLYETIKDLLFERLGWE